MGQTVVVYFSKHGMIARYAQWIADELSCDAPQPPSEGEQELTEEDRGFLATYGGRVDFMELAAIAPIVAWARQ